MSAAVMISGVLFRAPEERTSKTGNPYVVATLKSREGDGALFWRLTAFSESARAEIMRCGDGDHLSVAGALTPGIYQPDGSDARLSLSIIVDQAIALKPKKRPPKPKEAKPLHNSPFAPARKPAPPARDDSLNDEVPW